MKFHSKISRAVRRSVFAFATLLASAAGQAQIPAAQAGAHQPVADLILVNGHVYTVDDARPVVSAFAVRNGRIVFAGSDRETRMLAGPKTRIVDAKGETVIPGMVDAHAHLSGLGTSLRNVQLQRSKTYDEVIARVVERAKTAKPGEWIVGRG